MDLQSVSNGRRAENAETKGRDRPAHEQHRGLGTQAASPPPQSRGKARHEAGPLGASAGGGREERCLRTACSEPPWPRQPGPPVSSAARQPPLPPLPLHRPQPSPAAHVRSFSSARTPPPPPGTPHSHLSDLTPSHPASSGPRTARPRGLCTHCSAAGNLLPVTSSWPLLASLGSLTHPHLSS